MTLNVYATQGRYQKFIRVLLPFCIKTPMDIEKIKKYKDNIITSACKIKESNPDMSTADYMKILEQDDRFHSLGQMIKGVEWTKGSVFIFDNYYQKVKTKRSIRNFQKNDLKKLLSGKHEET